MKINKLIILLVLFIMPMVALADLTLKFGVYAADKPTEMVKQFRPTLNVLEKKLSEKLNQNVTISIAVTPSYEEGISSIAEGKVDIAQLGPVSYVQAKEKNSKIEIIAQETEKGKKEFQGVIAIHADSPIHEITELKGKKFAFGDELSTIGRFLSQKVLLENGVHAKDLSHYEYLGRHDKVGAAVASKEFDAGALKEGSFKKLVAAGSPLKVLAKFPNVTKPWVGREGLSADVVTSIREALLEIKDPEALEALGQDGFIVGEDSDYEPTRVAYKENPNFFTK